MHERSLLVSYDLHVYEPGRAAHERADRDLVTTLERYGLAERVEVIVADSRAAEPPASACDLIFVDGDHSYEGVRADYEHWSPLVPSGGHLIFHDAVQRDYQPRFEGIGRLVREIETKPGGSFARVEAAGTLAHFVKT